MSAPRSDGLLFVGGRDPLVAGNMATMSADGDPTESRVDKAYRAIEGHENGWLDINKWVPIFDFDPAIAVRVAANGGLAFVIELSDPVSFSDTTRIAALWDDEVVAYGPATVREGSRVVITVPKADGVRLSLWA